MNAPRFTNNTYGCDLRMSSDGFIRYCSCSEPAFEIIFLNDLAKVGLNQCIQVQVDVRE